MSVVNNKWIKWQQVAGISVICGLAVTGCSRSDEADNTETVEAAEQPVVDNSAVAPAVGCDDPMVQDRLKNALKNTLNQQAQILATTYASDSDVSLDSGTVSGKINGIKIDVQNAAVLQAANANGMTTCQASVSMTLPSEDLYQASQINAANNQPSLQTRLAQDNIRINNNMLVDDAFTYVAGAQGGQVQARIAGQPALITVVADVMAGSVLKTAIDNQHAQRPAQETPRRREPSQNNNQSNNNQNNNQSQPTHQPETVTPAAPAKPAQPATLPTINQGTVTPSADAKAPTAPKAPASAPKDESIDMVIIEDDSATY